VKERLDTSALFPQLALVTDGRLRDDVDAIWQELWRMSSFTAIEDVWVDPAIEYPQIRHQQALVRTALELAATYEQLHGTTYDRDVLIAGALLADVSKLVEFELVDGRCVRSPLGSRLPHATYAVHMALARGVALEVVHIIASHSPFSPTRPATREAQLVYWLDQADLTAFGDPIWTRRVTHLADPDSAFGA
jgi:hypothetical protein